MLLLIVFHASNVQPICVKFIYGNKVQVKFIFLCVNLENLY